MTIIIVLEDGFIIRIPTVKVYGGGTFSIYEDRIEFDDGSLVWY